MAFGKKVASLVSSKCMTSIDKFGENYQIGLVQLRHMTLHYCTLLAQSHAYIRSSKCTLLPIGRSQPEARVSGHVPQLLLIHVRDGMAGLRVLVSKMSCIFCATIRNAKNCV